MILRDIRKSKILEACKSENNNMNSIFTIFYLLLLLNISTAQFIKSIDVSSWYDDNIYRSPEKTAETVTDFSLDLNYQPKNSGFNFGYNGSYLLYHELGSRNFSLNGLGLGYTRSLDDEERYTIYLGANGLMRVNNEEYNYYDYGQIYAYMNMSFSLNWFYLKSGYNYRYRNYSNLSDLTNNRHYGFIQINKSFKTRTTLIMEADLGYKSFSGQEFTTTYVSGGGGGGNGHGRMSESSTVAYTSTSTKEIPALTHAILLARISQSLHTKVGIYFQYRKQISLTDETNYVNSDNYYQDEEIFDDPFSYESDMYSGQLTWMLPWQMKLQIGSVAANKHYISELAFESVDDTTGLAGIRKDKFQNIYSNFTKTFFINKNWINSLVFNINYGYIRNESNSYWYTYKNAIVSSGIQWTF
jgi:hypothetical protein